MTVLPSAVTAAEEEPNEAANALLKPGYARPAAGSGP
jgi:hypothetical protein